jgi:hypothetical protein
MNNISVRSLTDKVLRSPADMVVRSAATTVAGCQVGYPRSLAAATVQGSLYGITVICLA